MKLVYAELKKELATLARKTLTHIISKKTSKIEVTSKNIHSFLGVRKYRFGEIDDEHQIGVVTGLAWTSVGGDTLTIEAVAMSGKGKMSVTGNLKEVMKESISAANSYVQSKAPDLGISPLFSFGVEIYISMYLRGQRLRTALVQV